jgi:ATP-dependent Clp protease adaptor protein ClpS
MPTAPVVIDRPEVHEDTTSENPWIVFLWDDPVNNRSYVVAALQEVFGYSREKASQLMLEADTRGRTPVWSGSREQAEFKAQQLHTWTLQASVGQD